MSIAKVKIEHIGHGRANVFVDGHEISGVRKWSIVSEVNEADRVILEVFADVELVEGGTPEQRAGVVWGLGDGMP